MALESQKLDELYQLVLQAARLLAPLPEIVVQARPSIQRTQVIAKGKPLSEIVIEERC